MNQTQLPATIAAPIAFLAGLLAGKGVFGFDTETWTIILGSLATVGMTVWAAIATRRTALVTTVANMPEVGKVTLIPGMPGVHELNEATPDNVKVQA